MIDAFLVPEKTVVAAKGDSEPVDISSSANPVFLLTLTIAKVVEQEAIEITVFTSSDGAAWEPKPVATLSQKFYPGEYPLLVDLSAVSAAKYLRAHWDVTRWGRGAGSASFEMSLRLREVSRDALQEAAAATA
jgi:hypothetical protein